MAISLIVLEIDEDAPMSPATRRADAERNRTKILAAAREAYAEQGLGASLDGIARRAGVGPGTLYRHFAGRDEVVAAILEDEMVDLEREFTELRDGDLDPDVKITRWISVLHRWMTRFDGLPDPLRVALEQGVGRIGVRCEETIGWTEELLAEGRRAGVVKDAVTGRDPYRAALGLAWVAASTGDSSSLVVDPLHSLLRQGWRVDG